MYEIKEYAGLIRNHKVLSEELDVDTAGLDRESREKAIMEAAYSKWGHDLGNHINGQFAAIFEDTETGDIFATRDVLGAELLFFYETDTALICSTAITDILDHPLYTPQVNEELVPIFLQFTYVPGEHTLFKDIEKVEPGGWLSYTDGHLELGKYWTLSFDPQEDKDLDQWADEIEETMKAAVQDVCDDDDEYTSFLSGGVDSSYIMAMSNSKAGLCCAYDDSASEEVEAAETAKALGRDFHAIRISQDDVLGCLDEFIRAYEQPSADIAGLALYAACKKMTGMTDMCFSGEGADEFFGGYSVYAPKNATRMSLPGNTYMGTTHIMNHAELKRYLKAEPAEHADRDLMTSRAAGSEGYDPVSRLLYTDLRGYFEGSILFNSTKIARGTGLDIRMPYCDLRMFDIACRMPSRFKATQDGNKLALRKAAERVLPMDAAYRKKMGFPVPISNWMKTPEMYSEIARAFESSSAEIFFNTDELGALLDSFLGKKPRVSHPIWFARHKALLWRHIWTIYVFIRWHEIFFGAAGK